MKQPSRASSLVRQISTLPLWALRLSRGKRVLIVAVSYGLAIPGLWLFFPLLHNGISMDLPILSACWLFRYRGLLLCLPSILLAIGLIFLYLLPSTLSSSGQDFVARAVTGLAAGLLLGLGVCWLRTAVDLMHAARQQAQACEQERLREAYLKGQVTLAYEQQCKITEMKDHFLLNVNHELRTPLMVLGSSLELLKAFLDPTEQQAEMLTLAQESHQELVSLVSQVLNAATVAQKFLTAQSEAVSLYQLVQKVVAHLDPADMQAYTFHVLVPEALMVWADPQHLSHVLANLLDNVFKYVPKQTEIRIQATSASASSPVCLSVQDAGPGIPTDELPLLFEKFVRLKRDLGGTTHGTGLGLYICKQLVEAMAGHIWVESSGCQGQGSRFYVTLPPFSPA